MELDKERQKKGNWQKVDGQKEKTMIVWKGIKLLGFRRQYWTSAESVEGIKGHKVLPLPLIKRGHPNSPKETLQLVGYLWSTWAEKQRVES